MTRPTNAQNALKASRSFTHRSGVEPRLSVVKRNSRPKIKVTIPDNKRALPVPYLRVPLDLAAQIQPKEKHPSQSPAEIMPSPLVDSGRTQPSDVSFSVVSPL